MLATNSRLAQASDEDGLTALHLAVVRLRDVPNNGDKTSMATRAAAKMGCTASPTLTSYDRRDLFQGGSGHPRSGATGTVDSILQLSIAIDQRPMADLLLAHGASVNARTKVTQMAPLHLAVVMGHDGVAETLLRHGAEVNAADSVGLTALGMAAQTGHTALAKLLLDHGAPIDRAMPGGAVLPVFKGDTPLALATLCDHRDMVALLLGRGANPNQAIREGFRPLHLVESAEVATLLLDHGADLNGQGHEGRTPLHQAALQGRTDLVRLFLERHVNPDAQDARGDTPLLAALSQPVDSAEVIRLLIAHGAKVNARTQVGQPALHMALSRNRRILVMLLDAGASIDAPDRYGRTVLHWGVEGHDLDLVELLLRRGAAVNPKDTTGHTPLYYTWGGSDVDKRIADLLRQYGGVNH